MTKEEAHRILSNGLVNAQSEHEWCMAFEMAIKALEQEPKTGHWVDADGDNAICGCCNRLNHLYGTYCKHCGARMVEPQERSDKA